MRKRNYLGLGFLLIAGCSAPNNAVTITEAEFGKTWPFTVSSGILKCEKSGKSESVTFTIPDGTTYGVNGAARDKGHPDPKPIWKPNPEIQGARINIGAIIDKGRTLCNK